MQKEDLKQGILEAIEYKELDIKDFDAESLCDELDCDGTINEIIDSCIDIYYYDLRKWAVDNYDYIEDAINEGLVDTSDFDFHKAIQAGQYVLGQELAREVLEELYEVK